MDAYLLDQLHSGAVFLLFQGIQVACEVVLRKFNVERNVALFASGWLLGGALYSVGPFVKNRMFPGPSVERPAIVGDQLAGDGSGVALILVTMTRLRIRTIWFLRHLKREIAAGKEESALVSLIEQYGVLSVTDGEIEEDFADTSLEFRTKLKGAAFRRPDSGQ
jgi:hypothetical protein